MNIFKQKKILVISESIDVEDSSGSKANVALILNLKECGFEVVVYHYTRKEIRLPGIICIAIKERKWNSIFLLSRAQRKLQHGLKINLAKYLEPLFGFSFTFWNDSKSIRKSLQNLNFKPDLVVTLSKGASFRPHHALLALPQLHKKWMAYMHDPYPFHLYPEPYTWSEPGYSQKINFFKEVAASCQWAGYPSKLLGEWMENYFKDFRGKQIIIPHQVNKIREVSVALPNWFDPSKFNILHAGNLMKQRNPFPLIKGFQKFLLKNRDAREDARLLLVGNASYHFHKLKKLAKVVEQLIISEGYLAYDVVLRLQEKSSVNIILESVAKRSPFLPGKFSHCVAVNKPILHLGPEKSEVKRLLGLTYDYWSEADDVEKICSQIEKLYRIWKDNPGNLKLNREDLDYYLSVKYLKEQVNSII